MRFAPARRLAGRLAPPPDKSISHRAALIGAMCDGEVRVRNYLRSQDTASTLAAVHELGASIVEHQPHGAGADLVLHGVGLRGAGDPGGDLDVGNAGTLLRLLPGWLAGQGRGRWTLDGDESIRRRPVDRIIEPLRLMGARLECREGRLPPLVVEGARLKGIRYELPVASAQVKSCVLLAGLLADGSTTVSESMPSRDHTERMLAAAGADLTVAGAGDPAGGASEATVRGAERLSLGEIAVPGDFSSAAFLAVAAAIVDGSEAVLEGVGSNPTRTGLLTVMERMGARVELTSAGVGAGEPAGDLVVRHGPLRGTSVSAREVPLLIDELPLVALLGAFAEGRTVVEGAAELRHKESDRITTVVAGLAALGADIEELPDGFVVEGAGGLRGGTLDAAGDHRLAMLGAVAGLASREGVEVCGFEAAAVSYPGFRDDLARLVS